MKRTLFAGPRGGVYHIENVYSKNMAAVDPDRDRAAPRAPLRQRISSHGDFDHDLPEDWEEKGSEDSPIVTKTDNFDTEFAQVLYCTCYHVLVLLTKFSF
jgi:hypothetical protein